MTDRRNYGAPPAGSVFFARCEKRQILTKFITPSSARVSIFILLAALASAPAWASDIKAGQSVYEKHCLNCHGPEGTPTMPGTPDFARGEGLDVTDLDLARGIKQGKNLMPAYDALIKDDDVLNVISYIRTLRR